MRARSVVGLVVGLALLACTGTVEAPDGEDIEQGTDEGADEGSDESPGKGKKKRRPDKGGDEEGGDDGGDGADDGDDGGDGGAAPKPAPPPDSPPDGIEQVDATTWKIQESKKDQWMENPQKFAGARAKGKGYELSGIKSGSDAWYIGLRNGDIVKEVNGYSLATEAEAIQAYGALQNAKKLNVKMRRGEGPVNHTYLIQ